MFSEEPEQALAKTVMRSILDNRYTSSFVNGQNGQVARISETEGLIVEANGEVNMMSEQVGRQAD